ncbi:ROK family protein [Symbioplanes lichenis]|uniref:ROK family protein n=1 Tax=Symbioplanes lichenis TaxID=1629072 RepID=UPI0027389856|nr:ROK family protein [Actinoplanes lichenis]
MPAEKRPSQVLRPPAVARSYGVAVGADVARRHLRVAVVGAGQEILASRAVSASADADTRPAEVLREAAALARELLTGLGLTPGAVLGAGLAVPAPLTLDGRIGSDTWLPAWAGLVPGEILGAALDGVPVTAGNDASLGALGEHIFGRARTSRNLMYVKAATGIGAGFVINGVLYRGAAGTAGEIGHVTLDRAGDPCRCGNRGCLEQYAGGAVILGRAHAAGRPWPGLTELAAAARAGDPLARDLVTTAGRHLGEALGTVVNVWNPDRILIGGELTDAGDLFLDPIRASLHRTALPVATAPLTVEPAALAGMSTALGAAALILSARSTGSALS